DLEAAPPRRRPAAGRNLLPAGHDRGSPEHHPQGGRRFRDLAGERDLRRVPGQSRLPGLRTGHLRDPQVEPHPPLRHRVRPVHQPADGRRHGTEGLPPERVLLRASPLTPPAPPDGCLQVRPPMLRCCPFSPTFRTLRGLPIMSTATKSGKKSAKADAKRIPFKVHDLALAELGRKEIRLAEDEMPGLMALRAKYAKDKPLAGARIMGSLHMTVQTAV